LLISGITVASKGHNSAVAYDKDAAWSVGLYSCLPGKMWLI
jgi:hypothetical protein